MEGEEDPDKTRVHLAEYVQREGAASDNPNMRSNENRARDRRRDYEDRARDRRRDYEGKPMPRTALDKMNGLPGTSLMYPFSASPPWGALVPGDGVSSWTG